MPVKHLTISAFTDIIDGFKDGVNEPFSSAENIAETLTRMGISYREKTISYHNIAKENANNLVQGYLQRCVFDDSIDLRQMCKNPITGNYLEKCVNKGSWCLNKMSHCSLYGSTNGPRCSTKPIKNAPHSENQRGGNIKSAAV